MIIDLSEIYQCQSCKAILDEKDIVKIKMEETNISYCPVCGYEQLKLILLKG